ncbi:hypothetical protein BDZ91DRAFT_732717 [Kalaharituber pfeilii]|nr:hypothetical protein BDZ91DRAFT_732717 [Kalaharituber pfeilii]
MPVQTRSHGRTAVPSITTKIKKAVTKPTAKSQSTPRKPTVKKTAAGSVSKKGATTQRTHKREPGFADKIEGVVLKIEGALTGRPGVKGAGTKKLRGTDGKTNASSSKAATRSHR